MNEKIEQVILNAHLWIITRMNSKNDINNDDKLEKNKEFIKLLYDADLEEKEKADFSFEELIEKLKAEAAAKDQRKVNYDAAVVAADNLFNAAKWDEAKAKSRRYIKSPGYPPPADIAPKHRPSQTGPPAEPLGPKDQRHR